MNSIFDDVDVTKFRLAHNEESAQFATATATTASINHDLSRRLLARREAACWRLFRRYLGPQCPSDPCDVAMVLMARGITGHVHGAEILLGSDQLGRGLRWDDFVPLDRETI